jgi:hypothetical protein
VTEAAVWLSFAMNVVLAAWNVVQARRLSRRRAVLHRLLYATQHAELAIKVHLKEGHVVLRLTKLEVFTPHSMSAMERTISLLERAKYITLEKEDKS